MSDFFDELDNISETADLEVFRNDLLAAVSDRCFDQASRQELQFAFICEFTERLSSAEEFQELIPVGYQGVGYRNRRAQVDGYEFDEADNTLRLLISDFDGGEGLPTITKTKLDSLFGYLKNFIDECLSGRIHDLLYEDTRQVSELISYVERLKNKDNNSLSSVQRISFVLITDSALSERVKEFSVEEIGGLRVDIQVWDMRRLFALSSEQLGAEEIMIDFTEYEKGGLNCLRASVSETYDAYLTVISGSTLASIYDTYGSKLLEGNVRAFLGTTQKINRKIQSTIKDSPELFFAFNNGIAATATEVEIEENNGGMRLKKAKYLQIVNGGQTTASLLLASQKSKAELDRVFVPMKLSVVTAHDYEALDEMIQNIARSSNSQNQVSEADFFSNHPFHRNVEKLARSTPAPAAPGEVNSTYWFYERVRGQYNNEISKLTGKAKRDFPRTHPKVQLITKTDLAKFENSSRCMPHIVSTGAQKNFKEFAYYIDKEYGEIGAKFNNPDYYKEVVAKAIIFKFIEKLVSRAKGDWYQGDYRAQIVTYTMAKLYWIVKNRSNGLLIDHKKIWLKQSVSAAMAELIELIAKQVVGAITSPPVKNMNITEWCKKLDCWKSVEALDIPVPKEIVNDLIAKQVVDQEIKETVKSVHENHAIDSVLRVVQISREGGWRRLREWARSNTHSDIVGTDASLVEVACKAGWVPSDRQAARLIKVYEKAFINGFR